MGQEQAEQPLMDGYQPFFELPRLPPRPRTAHKGTFGTVFVVGGCQGMAGAAVLAGRAALRGGAGLVRVVCPANVWNVVAAAYPGYTTWGIPLDADNQFQADAAQRLAELAVAQADVLAVGPGLGRESGTIQFVRQLWALVSQRPWVLDADGLFAISPLAGQSVPFDRPTVLTPHAGEFARLTGWPVPRTPQQRLEQVLRFTRRWPVVLLLKGSDTLVSDGQRLYVNRTGNPGMATGGSGDVLTGLLAALVAQGLPVFEAAVLAAWVHGRAGDRAAASVGQTALTAVDLLEFLPVALREVESSV